MPCLKFVAETICGLRGGVGRSAPRLECSLRPEVGRKKGPSQFIANFGGGLPREGALVAATAVATLVALGLV
jgi:hypothetical protein